MNSKIEAGQHIPGRTNRRSDSAAMLGLLSAAILSTACARTTTDTSTASHPDAAHQLPATHIGQPLVMDGMIVKASPTEPHKVLNALVGSWWGTATVWSTPGGTPAVFECEVVREWDERRLFVIERIYVSNPKPPKAENSFEYDSLKGLVFQRDAPFEGMSMFGFSASQRRFVGLWTDSSDAAVSAGTGKYDADAGMLSLIHTSPGARSAARAGVRTVMVSALPNAQTIEHRAILPSGQEFKYFEATVSRSDR